MAFVLAASAATGSGGANLATSSKTVTITRGAGTYSSTGASIVIQKDLLKDLAGNKVGALSGSVITDTTKPTVVGLPTYTLAGSVRCPTTRMSSSTALPHSIRAST